MSWIWQRGALKEENYPEVAENTEFAEKSRAPQSVANYLPVAVEAVATGA